MAMEAALVLAMMAAWAAIASGYPEDIRIGVLLPSGDETKERIVERVLRQRASLQVVTERLDGDSDFHYHSAACRLHRAGCCSAVLSPSCRPLPGQWGVACPGAPSEAPDDLSLPLHVQAVGTRPDTTRATLDLLRDLGWREIVYLHDHPNGAEKLQVMFRVGYSALRLRVAGLLRVQDAREAAQLLLQEGRRRHVLLDAAPHLAQELLSRMTHAGRTQHSFLVMQPTLPDFWLSPELRALDVIGFSLPQPPSADFGQLTVEDLYFHDAALFLSSASAAAWRSPQPPLRPPDPSPLPPECEGGARPPDHRIADILKKVVVSEGLTGSLQFSAAGGRTNVTLTVMKTSRQGPLTYGWWSDAGKVGGIRRNSNRHEGALPQIQDKRVLRITTRLSEPFTMRGSNVSGEWGLEGFCVELAAALCAALQPLECHVYETPDGRQGHYDPQRGTWDGMVGEIVTGRADLAIGDLSASASRMRAADFLQPFLQTSLSLLLSRPRPSSCQPFSWGVWGGAAGAALLCGLALHALGRLSGAPDSIEASSAIWERRITPLMSGWLTLGSALLQPTGVYPRSLSSRVLAGSWWSFTGFLGCMLVASMAAQLQASSHPPMRQLQALSLEALIAEALENGWPEIGVVSPSFAEDVIQESSVPLLVRLRSRVRRVASEQEGAALAQEPGFALLTHSAWAAARRPCRLAAVHGTAQQGALAVALAPALEPDIKASVEAAFEGLHSSGFLGHLHRKWWIENSQCKGEGKEEVVGGVSSVGSLLIGAGAALLLLLLSFGVQLSRKIHTKESRRQQLTFEDINFDQRLPTPPPEMLAPPPVLEVPEIEGGGRSEESFKDFFDRMRTTSSS